MDAALVEYENGDTEIVDSDEIVRMVETHDPEFEFLAELELLRSWDHGLRAADETAASIATELAEMIVGPIVALMGRDPAEMDSWQALADEIGESGYVGGWCENPDSSQALYELCDEIESAAGSAGFIVESSADCGMTWLYLPDYISAD